MTSSVQQTIPMEPLVPGSLSEQFVRESDCAQYKGASYSNAIRVERGISLDDAFQIASENEEISFFFYVKGGSMVLELPSDYEYVEEKDPLNLVTWQSYISDEDREVRFGFARIFHHGDVVFFGDEEKWLGSAPGLADVYSKLS